MHVTLCRPIWTYLARTNSSVLDDIVSELWRKENVTSGYCPRYRYTLIATLTLANSYYICVDFLPTHTIGESVLPAHFLRVIRRLIRRSFYVDRFFRVDHVRFVRDSFSLSLRWVIFVASFVRVLHGSHSLGHSLFHVGRSFVRDLGSLGSHSLDNFVRDNFVG
jgi:hypothetical protein